MRFECPGCHMPSISRKDDSVIIDASACYVANQAILSLSPASSWILEIICAKVAPSPMPFDNFISLGEI
ncbi:hypothetical protein PCANC_27743 [Puccinia coronata f. sp. avenae]|uniref:Uncharacterized protein n=1 Tax=Puccinia coronata f. sp. avenae TaxID=200324 RepID=A0A2N5T9N2_9BASI|nr:hypothetical protein PCANC_27743 [Puccinia coronata f. sp. avenae]